MQRGFIPILIIILIAAGLFGAYYLGKTNKPQTVPQITQPSPTPADETANHIPQALQQALKQPDGAWDLDLSNNSLTTVPSELYRLKNLRTLYLNNNKISTLPAEFKVFTELELLDLTGNPITQIEVQRIKKFLPKTNILLIDPMKLP